MWKAVSSNYIQFFKSCIKSKFVFFIVSKPILTVIFLVSVVVFFSFPSYDIAFITNDMDGNWSGIFRQSHSPFVNHNHLYGPGSHEEKLAFRFVPAIILNVLNIHTKGMAMIFQFVTVIFFYFMLVSIYNKLFLDKIKALVFMLPICLVFAGHVYVSDYKGVFDTLGLCFLLVAFLGRVSVYSIVPLLLAFFTDERALIASPAIILFNLYERGHYENLKIILKETFVFPNLYIIISWVLYFIIRFSLYVKLGLETGSVSIDIFFSQFVKTFFTLYVGLEAFIIPFFLVLSLLFRKQFYAFAGLILVCYFTLFIVAQSVFDISRSMSYVILLLILITRMFNDLFPNEQVWKVIAWVILLNMFYGDTYPFLAQLYRMKFITGSI
jgi:hypothetical protein